MKSLNAHKGIVLAIFVFIVVIIAYNFLAPSSSAVAPNLVTSGPGAEVVALDSSLESINFDQSIFTAPSFVNLTDFSTPLPTQTVGRVSPFDAL